MVIVIVKSLYLRNKRAVCKTCLEGEEWGFFGLGFKSQMAADVIAEQMLGISDLLQTIKEAHYSPIKRRKVRGRRDVCFYAMNYLNCIPQGNLVCDSQGVIVWSQQ